jgi:hypothetical protein
MRWRRSRWPYFGHPRQLRVDARSVQLSQRRARLVAGGTDGRDGRGMREDAHATAAPGHCTRHGCRNAGARLHAHGLARRHRCRLGAGDPFGPRRHQGQGLARQDRRVDEPAGTLPLPTPRPRPWPSWAWNCGRAGRRPAAPAAGLGCARRNEERRSPHRPKKQDALAGKASYLLTRWCGVERVGMTTNYMQVYSATRPDSLRGRGRGEMTGSYHASAATLLPGSRDHRVATALWTLGRWRDHANFDVEEG